MGKLEGKIALITGAGSGIGRATAMLFAQEGARVAVADWDEPAAKNVVGEIGEGAIAIKVDVSKAGDVEKMIAAVVSRFGRLDILYNNAGVCIPGMVHTMSEEAWDRTININLKGVFLGCKYGLAQMIKQGGGVILNTASVAGLEGHCGLPDYCASKHGVIGLTKSIALDYAQHNIRANCICPGGVQTNIAREIVGRIAPEQLMKMGQMAMAHSPIKRQAQPEEIARAALFLCSEDSSFITGHTMIVDGGWMAGHHMAFFD